MLDTKNASLTIQNQILKDKLSELATQVVYLKAQKNVEMKLKDAEKQVTGIIEGEQVEIWGIVKRGACNPSGNTACKLCKGMI